MNESATQAHLKTGTSSPRVCYLVTQFPLLSETFIANSFFAVAKRCTATLIAREHTTEPDHHGYLKQTEPGQVMTIDTPGITWEEMTKIPGLIRRHGIPGGGGLSIKRIGYQTMLKGVHSVALVLAKMEKAKPDIIHANFAGNAFWGDMVARELKIPFTVAVHGSDIRRCQQGSETAQSLKRAAAVTCVDHSGYESLVDRLGISRDKITLVPNGVDTSHFRPLCKPQPGRMIAVGRLHHIKGHDILLEAMAILKQREIVCSLDIVGEGPLRQSLTQQMIALGLEDRVRLVGAISQHQLPEYISRASLMVQPSRGEGLPCTLLEAMACGRAVVATRVGGVPELVSEHTGFLCPSDDPIVLADAMAYALADEKNLELKGQQARQIVIDQFSWEKHADQLIDIWRHCCVEQPNVRKTDGAAMADRF